MISGLAEMDEAIKAIRLGAFDFIEKPLKPERLLVSVRNAARLAKLRENRFQKNFIIASDVEEASSSSTVRNDGSMFELSMPLSQAKRILEKKYIETQIAKYGGSVQKTADALGILANNLSRRIKQLKED